MHNCRETKEQLTEILLDGVDAGPEKSLGLDQCSECRTEFETLRAALRMTARIHETTAPAESYWSCYHDRLREKLLNAREQSHTKAQRRQEEPVPFFAPLRLCARIFLSPVRIPLGIVALLLLTIVGLVVIRTNQQPASPVITYVPVEVPVIKEKTVAQIVYRERRQVSKPSKRVVVAPTAESTFARFGFKPTEEVNLTVIKGGTPNEK